MTNLTLEDRIKTSLGEILFGNLILQHQVEELTAKLHEVEGAPAKSRKAKTAEKTEGK